MSQAIFPDVPCGGPPCKSSLIPPVPVTPTGSTINLAIEEDQARDTERRHTTEQVAYFIIDPPSTATSSLALETPATRAAFEMPERRDKVLYAHYLHPATFLRDNNFCVSIAALIKLTQSDHIWQSLWRSEIQDRGRPESAAVIDEVFRDFAVCDNDLVVI